VSKSQRMTDHDDQISNPTEDVGQSSFAAICERRYSRRQFVKRAVSVGVATATMGLSACSNSQNQVDDQNARSSAGKAPKPNYDFVEIEHGSDQHHHVAPDHQAQVLLRWGDPIFDSGPQFNPLKQTVESQRQQFGYNNDYVGYLQLGSETDVDNRALLCVNHEYPLPAMMFPNYQGREAITAEQIEVSQASMGVSIVEVRLQDNEWAIQLNSPYNRRINALDSLIRISGPVAGHERVRTKRDPSGKKVIGTINNCAGGMTPWGTFLTCEENFNFHFSGELSKDHPEQRNYQRYNLRKNGYINWATHDKRFSVEHEPNEPNRFGWVVEIDPKDPTSIPKKRTALGRFKHEGGENVITQDGRLAVYMGDDQRFEYLYKFVSRDKVDLANPENNQDLLDFGTLYVAKLFEQGNLQWLPLTIDNPVLKTTFTNQAEILLETRRAADLLGATPLDRPEDVVPDKTSGKVYVMLTNNTKRKDIDVGSPRIKNAFGHIIELSEENNDHGAEYATWDILVKCGDPDKPSHDADWNPYTSRNGWFASPDNAVLDPSGRLWVSSDQGSKVNLSGTGDGLWALETNGELRGTGKMFFRVPNGAEMTGPAFSNDGQNLFLAVQHPGDGDSFEETTISQATTRWPDFQKDMPPRPSLVVVRKKGGGVVG